MPRSPTELRQTLRPTQTRRTGIKVDVAFWTSFCSPVKICAFSMQADGAADIDTRTACPHAKPNSKNQLRNDAVLELNRNPKRGLPKRSGLTANDSPLVRCEIITTRRMPFCRAPTAEECGLSAPHQAQRLGGILSAAGNFH